LCWGKHKKERKKNQLNKGVEKDCQEETGDSKAGGKACGKEWNAPLVIIKKRGMKKKPCLT